MPPLQHVQIILFWEKDLVNFRADSLEFALSSEVQVPFPSLIGYLVGEGLSSQKTAIQSYLEFCNFLRHTLNRRYADGTVSLADKTLYNLTICKERDECSKKLSGINDLLATQTAKNKAEKNREVTNLAGDPERLRTLLDKEDSHNVVRYGNKKL